MADLADKSGSVYSNIVNNNDDSVTYTIPNTPTLSVESVVATVDNSAAGSAATLTITIQDQDGQVIHKRAMGDTIPAGDTGTATFALGLDEALTGAIRFNRENFGHFLSIFTDAAAGIIIEADNGGQLLLDANGLLRFIAESSYQLAVTGQLSATVSADAIETADTWQISTTSGTSIESTGPITIDSHFGSGKIILRVPVGASVEVQDSGQNPIFRVNENGDLQGKTGKALVFNL